MMRCTAIVGIVVVMAALGWTTPEVDVPESFLHGDIVVPEMTLTSSEESTDAAITAAADTGSCKGIDRGFKGKACTNKCEKGSHHSPWCYVNSSKKWAHCKCGKPPKKKKKKKKAPPKSNKSKCHGDCARAKKETDAAKAADTGSTRAKHVMDCSKPHTFFKKVDFDGSDIVKGIKNVPSASACCKKCSKYKTCEYWTYGTTGSRKNTCWVKSSMTGVESQDNRESGYYDPCQDTSNVEDGVDYQGSDLVHGGFPGVTTPKGCCQKCVQTKGCKYWTLGKDRAVCWVKSGYSGWEEQSNRASGTFVVNKDGSLTKPDPSKNKGGKIKKKKAGGCKGIDRGFKGKACTNKCEKGSHHSPWCYVNNSKKWAHCKCGKAN